MTTLRIIPLTCVLAVGAACSSSVYQETEPIEDETVTEQESSITRLESGLGIEWTSRGDGAQAEPGMTVTAHYTGRLTDGTKFDSSVDRGTPFEFILGRGMVIQGWDLGFAEMSVGDKAVLHIPSELGYGSRGAGGAIPPNADLVFEVELLGVR